MIIRHAEKPGDAGPDRGVTVNGVRDRHDLTVRGWQRAGALTRFFAPVVPFTPNGPVATPRSIMAAAATAKSPSRRAKHTVKPLAAMLDLHIDDRFANGSERAVAAAALAAPAPVLIVWHHHHIVRLARSIGGEDFCCPATWPDDCFDAVWVLDLISEGHWSFTIVRQNLLADDRFASS